MSKIKLTLPDNETIVSGKQITFTAPCDCSVASCVQINGVDYDIVDSSGTSVANTGAWTTGALVTILLDTTSHHAYILNSAAAPKSHKHNASDITAGTLPPERGGTGVTKLAGSGGLLKTLFPSSVTTGSIPILGSSWENNGYASTAQLRSMLGVPTTTEMNTAIANSGGFVASNTAPTNTKVLWIDTGNGGILKYYNSTTTSWVPTTATWG